MIVKTKVLHTEFSFEKNKYTNKPSMFSIFVFSHKKNIGSVLVEVENNKFILSEEEYKDESVLTVIANLSGG